VITIIH